MKTNKMKNSHDLRNMLLAVIATAGVATMDLQAQLITDGSFETPVLTNGVYAYGPTNSVWQFWLSAGLISPPGSGPAGTFNAPPAPTGRQIAFLQTGAPVPPELPPCSLSQPVVFPVSGQYRLTYREAGRAGSYNHYNVLVDSEVVVTNIASAGSQPFTARTYLFHAAAGAHVFMFQNVFRYTGTDSTTFFDDVTVVLASADDPNVQVSIQRKLSGCGANSVAICWFSELVATYTVQWKRDLSDASWTNLGSPIPGTGDRICVCDSIGSNERRFYRLAISR